VSNYLAVATVSAVLRSFLQMVVSKATAPGLDISVATGRPEAPQPPDGTARVSLFLYQVTPNAAWRNADLPTRRSDGTVVQRPQAAIDLHYLISFAGDESKQVPERMLGAILPSLHAQPILSRDLIRNFILSAGLIYLADSDLADQAELVRLMPLSLTVDELSKLWSVFFQFPYRLSVALQASVVLLDVDVPVERALPVVSRNIEAKPLPESSPIPSGGPVRPVITVGVPSVSGAGRTLPVTVTPAVGSGQQALLLLNEHFGPRSFAVPAPPRTAAVNVLVFPLPAQAAGATYLVRVEVDGVESLLDPNPNDPDHPVPFSGPLVTL
jgi:hypothetical protein